MNRILAAVFCLTFAAPCISSEGQACNSLGSLRWMLGDWVADGSKTTFHESWRELGPKSYEGTGIERSKEDGSVPGGEDLSSSKWAVRFSTFRRSTTTSCRSLFA